MLCFVLILQAGYIDIWEPATLAIKKEGYSIKCSGPRGVVVTEKFSQATSVMFLTGFISLISCENGLAIYVVGKLLCLDDYVF